MIFEISAEFLALNSFTTSASVAKVIRLILALSSSTVFINSTDAFFVSDNGSPSILPDTSSNKTMSLSHTTQSLYQSSEYVESFVML